MAEATARIQERGHHPGRNLEPLRLDILVSRRAASHPDSLAVCDPPERARWSGLQAANLTYDRADEATDRVARLLASCGLSAAANVAVVLPNGSEAWLAIVGCQRAGACPCLMSPAWGREQLVAAMAAIGAEAVITQTRIDGLAPARLLCEVAASFFGLRFLFAFGPDPPDGVIALDPILERDGTSGGVAAEGHARLATFEQIDGRWRPAWRDTDALLAATIPIVLASRMREGSRIVSLAGAASLAGLATGLAAALVSGAPLCTHGLFDSTALMREIESGSRPHLVAPALIEPSLREAGVVDKLASLVLVHRPPAFFPAEAAWAAPIPVVDVLSLGETTLVTAARDPSGVSMIRVGPAARPLGAESLSPTTFVELRSVVSGMIEARGRAVVGASLDPLERAAPTSANRDGWLSTRFAAVLDGERIVAVRTCAEPHNQMMLS